MATLFRWLFRATVTLILLGLLGFGLVWWLAARSLPDYDGERTVSGITAPVEIVRDHSNVPHIFGQTDADVFFGLGYAHAQDRLWQMIVLRRTAQGRLSEVFGARTLPIDRLLRRLDLYGLATASVAAQDETTLAALEAYSAGVNAWLHEINAEARGRGAPEMWLFPQAVAPWQPADSLALLKLMALQLNGHLEAEVRRARLSLVLPPERVADLMPEAPGPGVAALPRYADLVPAEGLPRFAAADPAPRDPLMPAAPLPLAGASNAWAAGVSRTASGSTLLASDPHLPLSAPGLFYLARIELTSGGVIGGTIPGIPAILSGRSADLGWGITSSWLDDLDVYAEEVNPRNAGEYRTPDGWAPFRTRDSIIQVKDAPAETLHLQWTANGPVLGPEDFNLGLVRPPGHVMAVSWTALSDRDTTMTAAIRLMRAQNIEEALEAARLFVAPSQNLVVADRNRIAMTTMGTLPVRDPAHQSQGRMPTLGWIAQNRWLGVKAPEANPVWIDPEGGIVGNTNNKVIDAPFPDHLSWLWGDSQRVQRWRFLMQAREIHTRESFIEAQLDTVSPAARTLLPLVGRDLWFTGEAAPDGTPERLRQRALALLAEWNGQMNEHLPEPLIYAAWMRALQERLIRDDLGPLADEFTQVEPLFIERVFRNVDGASAWCDVRQSAPVETCTDIARLALDDALLWIRERWGTQIESLRWGDAHEAVHAHPVLGSIPLLSWFVNIRQSTSGDDQTLMRGVTAGTEAEPFRNVHAAAYRGVYDFADPDSSVFIIATGQSGHPLSPHYDDLGVLWRRGEYIPMSLDPALARAAAVGITRLLPESAE
ncbi:Protein related to penicillin acylase [Rubellimicrobium thermophilum DSM 16684]|uniref:Protein related to penicillin acylase n=1 Tax=Rubellimicrobium thermophilum DSM 16684 TaxID=1123069 RepID=S9SIJ3_9RHOB|nr:penicillin acylase family protein [Rubellimicrobium thermophilum]EPX86159.1 Protein related to penicillin acylase [Rubellimicrobium thermophilum DSM 16684]